MRKVDSNGWTPCSEERPKTGQQVILCRDGKLIAHLPVYRINCDRDLVDMREPADERAYWDFECHEADCGRTKDDTSCFIKEGDRWMPAPAV